MFSWWSRIFSASTPGAMLLVNMNGRVYEPRTGRFVSADPHGDGAATTQGWNRYAYVHGRVLSARDPSGFAATSSGTVIVEATRLTPFDRDYVLPRLSELLRLRPPTTGLPPGEDGLENIRVSASRLREKGASHGPIAPVIMIAASQLRTRPNCPTAPSAPSGVDIRNNIEIAGQHSALNPGSLFAFYQLVRNGGDWDYKQIGKIPNVRSPYEAFGNFHYGATGTAMGIPDQLLLRAAGAASIFAGTSPENSGNPLWHAPYGDSPVDQAWIKKGIQYARCIAGAEQ